MKVIITNAQEAGMPQSMISNCEILLARRFRKLGTVKPKIDILYSEKDPLMASEPWGEDAYGIYFKTGKISPEGEQNPDKVENLEVELVL
ncbi:MAG TPA: hypothetical protein VK177_03815 [Flavobacteriales bacterium]|nr:hypothetical protein [Flavobacteriales bacterium]